MKDDSFDCTLIAHLRIFLLFYRLLYCLILPENRLFFGIWKVVEIEFELFMDYLKNSNTAVYWYPVFAVMLGTGVRVGDDDDKIRLNQRKPSKYKGLSRFGPEKTCNESTNL